MMSRRCWYAPQIMIMKRSAFWCRSTLVTSWLGGCVPCGAASTAARMRAR